MLETPRSLNEHALLMKNAAPAVYDDFCDAVERYVDELFAGVVRCPPDQLENHQGRVQQAHGFLNLLKTCHIESKLSEPAAR